MSNQITFWRGKNLGPQRKEFMKKNLRLEEVEITEEEIGKMSKEYSIHPITGKVQKSARQHFKNGIRATLSKLKGDE